MEHFSAVIVVSIFILFWETALFNLFFNVVENYWDSEHKECWACKSQNCSQMQLNGKISTQVKEFFQDPTEHMKKYFKIVEFQRGHREKLNKNRREEVCQPVPTKIWKS